jgi:hypothetical protein
MNRLRTFAVWLLFVCRFRGSTSAFVPLSCNNNFTPCVPWSRKFGNNRILSGRTTIQCGECIVMDQLDYPLEFANGLDIYGKLVIPDGVSVEMITPLLVVHGELDVTSTKPIDGTPAVRITMKNGPDMNFTPIHENSKECNGRCLAGKKAIVVAGGKLTGTSSLQLRSEF